MKTPIGKDSIITIGGLALIVAGFIFGIYRPVQSACAEAKKDLAAAQRSIDEIPQRVEELNSLKSQIGERENFIEAKQSLMPEAIDLHSVLRSVSDLARTSHLSLTRLEPLQVIEHDSYRITPFHVSFEGDFPGILQFVRGLEQQERLFVINEFALSGANGEASETVEGDMNFGIYSNRANSADYDENNSSSR